MNTTSPVDCPAWKKLEAHAGGWRDAKLAELRSSDAARGERLIAEAPGVRLDYSRQRVGSLTLALLAKLAAERGFDEWRAALFSGQAINTTENRAATHIALRADESAPKAVQDSLTQMVVLATHIRNKRTNRIRRFSRSNTQRRALWESRLGTTVRRTSWPRSRSCLKMQCAGPRNRAEPRADPRQ